MTHAEEIIQAVANLMQQEGKSIFTRDEVRRQIGLNHDEWEAGYTAIFQGMRSDHPGGAPQVGARFTGVFRRVEHGKYVLTDSGWRLLQEFEQGSLVQENSGEEAVKVVYTANRPNRTLTLHKGSCSHIPWDRLSVCGCGSTGKLGNQQWWCGKHITIEAVDQFMNRRLWAILLCHDCYE